jgi:hypothetical protein
MSVTNSARSALDRAFFALITRAWGARKIDGYEASLRKLVLYFWTPEK